MTTRDDQIRQRAHAIWDRDGRPDGRHEEHWQRAVEEIERELGAGDSQIGPKRASRSASKSPQVSPAPRRTRRANSTEASASSETPRKSRSAAARTASFATQGGSAGGSPAGDAQHTATEPDYVGEALHSAPVAVKYRHPESPELTWSGRGRRPAWIRDALEAGRRLTDFEVPS